MSELLDGLGLNPRNSINHRYGPRLVVEGELLRKREEFCKDVLGTHPMDGAALEVGCGIGFWTAALAGRYKHVVALDRSRTQCIIAAGGLYALGRHNVCFFNGTLPGLAQRGENEVRPRKRAFGLVTSFDGLRRGDVLNLSLLADYALDRGMVLVAFPAWWFGGGETERENELYEYGLSRGWKQNEIPHDGALERLDGGRATLEKVSLAYAAAMSGLLDLYDYKKDRPADDWQGPASFEVSLDWRLYHLPDDALRPPDSGNGDGTEEELTVEEPATAHPTPPPPPAP